MSAATIRGSYSDTRIIPDTGNPATAFVDQSALVIKLTHWTGSEFQTEVVAGEGTGAWVRLAFNSDQVPFVFWTLGNSLKVAVRSAPITEAGTWSAGVIDNSAVAPRAVEVAVNPLDQILVSYVTDAAATGRTRIAYCDTGCASATDFQAMTSNPYVENTNNIANMTSTGAPWC